MSANNETSTTHVLKIQPEHFRDVHHGHKRAEVRKNDRDYQVGDELHLREFDREPEAYTGGSIWATVTHVLRGPGYGIADGYAVLSIDVKDVQRNGW